MLLMFVSRAWNCGILIEKPKYVVFVCKSFADFAEIPLAGPECPSHVLYLLSDVPLFVTRCFSEPLDFWEEEVFPVQVFCRTGTQHYLLKSLQQEVSLC